MIPAGYELRTVSDDDFVAITELMNRIEQEKVSVEDNLQRWHNKNRHQWRRVVTKDGEIVAYAGGLQAITGGGEIYLLRVDVSEGHKGKGIGRELLALAEVGLKEFKPRIMTAKARDDMTREMRFLEAAGYEPFQNLRGITLDLSRPIDIPESGGSEQILSWSEIGDSPENRAKLYELYRDTDQDSPGSDVWGMPDFPNWEMGIFTGTWYLPEGLFVAVDLDKWVGMAVVGQMEDGTWTTDYTGVRPSHRGRGIATRLKVRGIRLAQERGGRELHTFNDELNGPMRAINAKLGFKAETGWWMYRKDPKTVAME